MRSARSAIYWPAPIAWEESTAIRCLIGATRDPDAGIVAIRLWQHRRRCGPVIPGPDAEATLEVVAGNGRRRKGWTLHLRAAGLVEDGPNGALVVRAWEDVAKVDWTRGERTEPADRPGPSPESLKRIERRRRAQSAGQAPGQTPDNGTSPPRTTPVSAPDSPDKSADSPPPVRPESAGVAQPDPRARICATETETETEEAKNIPPQAVAASPAPAAQQILVVVPQSAPKPRARATPRPALPVDPAVADEQARERAAERADADLWLATVRERLGYPESEAAWSAKDEKGKGGLFMAYRAARRELGAAALLDALDGHASDRSGFGRSCGVYALLSRAVIASGRAKSRGSSVTPHPSSGVGIDAAWDAMEPVQGAQEHA